MNIAIVTDSTSDLPDDLAVQHGIQVVPNSVVVEGRSLQDGKDFSRSAFYEQLPKMRMPPTTATASSGTYHELYTRLLAEGYEGILSIHLSSLLSGVYDTASMAAQVFGGRVQVVDSGSVSLGLGFQALEAAKIVSDGAAPDLHHVLGSLVEVAKRVRVIAMLDTLEYVRRSGRVSWAKARLGGMLRIKPFVEVKDGKVLSLGEARTTSKGVERLLGMLRGLGQLERLAVLHINNEDAAQRILKDLEPELPTQPLIVNITTVIGSHIGPGALGFAVLLSK